MPDVRTLLSDVKWRKLQQLDALRRRESNCKATKKGVILEFVTAAAGTDHTMIITNPVIKMKNGVMAMYMCG